MEMSLKIILKIVLSRRYLKDRPEIEWMYLQLSKTRKVSLEIFIDKPADTNEYYLHYTHNPQTGWKCCTLPPIPNVLHNGALSDVHSLRHQYWHWILSGAGTPPRIHDVPPAHAWMERKGKLDLVLLKCKLLQINLAPHICLFPTRICLRILSGDSFR